MYRDGQTTYEMVFFNGWSSQFHLGERVTYFVRCIVMERQHMK
jgi:hypothetical protein